MEDLAPPLSLLLKVRYGLLAGRSLRVTLQEALASSDDSEFHQALRKWWALREAGQREGFEGLLAGQSIYRVALFQLLSEGLEGVSLLDSLKTLEAEIRRAMEAELGEFVAALPLKSLAPLILFIFPSLMLVIFGPLIMNLMEAF